MKKNLFEKKLIWVLLLIVLIVIISIFSLLKNDKISSILINVNNTNTSNIRISMEPSYKTTVITKTNTTLKLDATLYPDNVKGNVEWILSNDCAVIDGNDLSIKKKCNFSIYATYKNIESNVIEFVVEE